MPRLTWHVAHPIETEAARAAFNVYVKRGFVATHEGVIVRTFGAIPNSPDPRATVTLTLERVPTSYDRLLKETDPWEL